MRAAYLWLARIIAILVVVQAVSIAWAFFGVHEYLMGGGTLDKAAVESETLAFPGIQGFPIHGINGQMVIPVVAVLLLLVSFFAKVAGGIPIAVVIAVLVALQVGVTMVGNANLGIWHGLGAMLILGAAIGGATKAKESPAAG